MPIIQFGPWLPDQARLGNRCITATNVYPVANGYAPFKDTSAQTDALPDICVGVISFKRVTGGAETFAGTEDKLYRKNGTTWDDVSRSSGYLPTTAWRFAVYGDTLVATNGVDNPQKFTISSGPSGVFSDLSNAPTHTFPIVVKDVLVALDVTDTSEFEIKFAAVNDAESWDAESGGGSQNVPDGGPVVGGTGGEFGVILQETGVTRMNFVGGDLRFTFDKIEGGIGCIAADSIVQYKGRTFYLSDEGFQLFDGSESRNISGDAVTKTFFSALGEVETLVTDTSEKIVTATGEEIVVSVLETVQGALDPLNSCVVWKYPTSSGNKLIIYNYRLDRWAESDASVDCLHTAYTNSGPVLAGFDSDKKLATFSGSARSATVSTGDIQVARDRASFVRAVRGLVDSRHDITVGKKVDMADSETTTTATANGNGVAGVRSRGRYHRFQVQPTDTWSELVGVEIEASRSGRTV